MSLYVGHLPPHVQPKELERVFRKFGRCNFQLKDGYGFIIYEVAANAEKALRALRGKVICGEHLSLNWSNRQPRPFQRSARSGRFYEPYRGRNVREEDNGFRFRGSQDRRGFTGTSRVPVHNREELHLDDVFDKETDHNSEDVDDTGRVKGASVKEKVIDEGVASELNPVENDRWGESASDALTGRGQEDDSDFDRYEPYHGCNRRDEKENNHRASSYGSREHGSSPENGLRERSFDEIERNIDKSKPPQICFNCGLAGHIMRNCPRGDARRENFSRFNHRREGIHFRDKGEERAKRLGPNPWGRPNSSRDPLISRRQTWDRMVSHYEKPKRVGRSETFPESKKIRTNSRADSQGKKRRKPENGTSKKPLKKRKSRRSRTSSPSDSSTTNSESRSKSLESSSATSSRSRSRSISSRSRSTSSSSRSTSASSYSKSPSSRSRSKSRSRSNSRSSFLRSRSLSVSLDQKSLPSPRHVRTSIPMSMSPKGNLGHVPSPESKHHLDNLVTLDPIGTSSTLKDEIVFPRSKVDGDDALYSTCEVTDMERNAFISNTHANFDVTSENQEDIDVTSENPGEKCELQGDVGPKLNMLVLPRCEASLSTRISTREMLSALKHYGLATPEEGESGISIEEYFGAARMWPWEMVYYRRLKKGPISTENYARRLEQNREFGIVDKYIRSSSGWGECHQSDS